MAFHAAKSRPPPQGDQSITTQTEPNSYRLTAQGIVSRIRGPLAKISPITSGE